MLTNSLRTVCLAAACVLSTALALAQTPLRVRGSVTDAEGQPLIGAGIVVEEVPGTGTITDLDGHYSLSLPEGATALRFSYIGLEDVVVPIQGREVIDVVMEVQATALEGVVVTALGIRRAERAVSYNVQKVDDSAFLTKDANMVNSLAGRIAGVQVNASSAGIGGETKVVMRGAKSIMGTNNALYVLDGIPLPALSITNPGDAYSVYDGSALSGDGISNFNPDDIADMSALVGPSAAALYGSKAANGVMMLSSRTGEKGLKVVFSNNTTFLTPTMLPSLQTSYGNKDGYYASWGQPMTAAPTWSINDFFQTGWNTANTLSLSLGGEHSSTYVSAGLVKAEGVIPNNGYGRKNVTATHTADFLGGRMHLSLLGMYMHVDEQNMTAGGRYYNPLIPLYLMSPADDLRRYAIYERYNPERGFQTQYWSWGDQGIDMQNPYWVVNRNLFNTGKDRFLAGGSLRFDITEWLDITGRVRTDYTSMLSQQKNYASSLGTFANAKGRYFYNEYMTHQTYADVLLNVHKNWAQISLNATLGASIEDYAYRSTKVAGDLIGVPNLFTLSNMEANRDFVKETINDQTQAVFATAQLGWRNRLFLDATLRSDWVSAIAKEGEPLKPIIYPSVGLSAVITDLLGMDSRVLPFAKVRVSYSQVGNAPLRFLANPTYRVDSGVPQTITYKTSPNFQPERTNSWEVGVDARLFDGVLSLSATYYSSQTFNQVFQPQISSTSTYSTYYINAGRIDNKGVEVSAELKEDWGPVKWTSNATFTLNRNKIAQMLDVEIDGEKYALDTLDMGGTSGVKMRLIKGGSIGDLYVNTLAVDNAGYIWVSPTGGTVDTDRNNFIKAGNTNPDFMLSWRNQLDIQRFSLAFMLSARIGGVGVSLTQAALDGYGVSARSARERAEGGVLVNGVQLPDVESFYTTVGGNGANAIGSRYVYSMTNVRLSELSLGYNLPVEKWVTWMKGLNLSVVGRNLFMLYCNAPFDPEQVAGAGNYAAGIDYFMMPSTRSVGFSVKVTF